MFIGVCTGEGCLETKRVLISAKSIIGMRAGFTFQTFVKQYEPVIVPPFLKGFPFQLSKNASHAGIIPIYKLAAHFATFLIHHLDPNNEDPSFHTPELDVPDPYSLHFSCLVGKKTKFASRTHGFCWLSADIADMRIPFQIISDCYMYT